MAGTRKATRIRTKKEFQDLEFQDAFMFAAVLEDEELCRKMLERILDFPIEKVVVQPERSLFVNSDFHGIRMDVYARDEDGTVYNVEMQTTQPPAHTLSKRGRYYQSQMDMALLRPGKSYENLPNSYVIFICTFDPFGRQRYRYTFREQCLETGDLLEDGSTKIFLNCDGHNSEEPRELQDFLRYVKKSFILRQEADAVLREDELIAGLESRVKALKKNRGLEASYMLFEEMLAEERREGYEEGRAEGQRILTLITAMTAAGEGQEISRLSDEEFREAMYEKYKID